MKPASGIRHRAAQPMRWLAKKAGARFFLHFAAVLSLLVVGDLAVTHLVSGMQRSTFDFLVRNRVRFPPPDRDIVVVDIDDASLKQLAPQYGRWPWPREVMGEMVSKLRASGARAIVFDIVFGEPDVSHAESDRRFVETVAHAENVFFPMVLLDESDPGRRAPELVPGAQRIPDSTPGQGKIAVLIPFFGDRIPAERIGTNNIVPDTDGIIRRFSLSHRRQGWEIPSIVLRAARALSLPPPRSSELLINWRGPPYSFTSVSFSHVLARRSDDPSAHLGDDFGGKIVIIGSTAASLFDIKASPMAPIHPGVEILATVLDNVKNADALHELPAYVYAIAAIAFVWVLAFTFYAERGALATDGLFVALQSAAIGLCYVLLNASNVYLDMTVPIAFSVIYYTVARIYAHHVAEFRMDRALTTLAPVSGGRYRLTVIAIRTPEGRVQLRRRIATTLERELSRSAAGGSRISDFFSASRVLANLFQDVSIIYWLAPADDEARASLIDSEALRLRNQLDALDPSAGIRSSIRSGLTSLTGRADGDAGLSTVLAAINDLA